MIVRCARKMTKAGVVQCASKMKTFEVCRLWNGSSCFRSENYFVSFSLSEQNLILSLDCPFFDDCPPDLPTGRCPGLYENEVVEVFISASIRDGDSTCTPYTEIEIGPHGHYLIIKFTGEANWSTQNDRIRLQEPPNVEICRKACRWRSVVKIPFKILPIPEISCENQCSWFVNIYGIHGEGESRRFLAYSAVEGSVPNFHQLKYFTPLVLNSPNPVDAEWFNTVDAEW